MSSSHEYMLQKLQRDLERIEKGQGDNKVMDLSSPVAFVRQNVALPMEAPKDQQDWFQNRDYLIPLYNDPSRQIIFVKGRQVEMTTYMMNQLLYHAFKYPGFYIYATSTLEKAKYFSKERMLRTIRRSPRLLPYLKEDNVHNIKIGDSTIHIYSAYGNLDTLRSYSAQALMLDEFQDINADALGVATEVLSHSQLKRLWILGTPKMTKTKYEEYWNLSDKKEWNKEEKKWIPTNTSSDVTFSGYHISQEIGLGIWITQEELEQKRRTYGKQRWLNEVLGQFYEGVGVPLTVGGLWGMFSPSLKRNDFTSEDYLFAGIDWGTGHQASTSFVLIRPRLIAAPDDWAIDVLNIERLSEPDVTQHVKRILQLVKTTPIMLAAFDEGEGFYQNAVLYKLLGDKMITVKTLSLTNMQKYPYYLEPSVGGIVTKADKTWIIDEAFDYIAKNRVRFYNEPDEEYRNDIIKDFLSVYPEVNEKTGRKSWIKDEGMTNDILMAFSYALLAFKVALQGGLRMNPSDDYSSFIDFT